MEKLPRHEINWPVFGGYIKEMQYAIRQTYFDKYHIPPVEDSYAQCHYAYHDPCEMPPEIAKLWEVLNEVELAHHDEIDLWRTDPDGYLAMQKLPISSPIK